MPTRRLVLTAALATVAAPGCTAEPLDDAAPAPDPDVVLAATALAAELGLLELLESVTTALPRLSARLESTRSVHLAHVELLDDAVGSSPTSTPTTSPVRFTGDARAAFLALARAEDRAGQALRRAAFKATSGQFARVLASMAAAAAQQSAWLRSQS